MPGREELPSTLERSSKKAQDTWVKAHDNAVDSYGEGRRAHQTAFAALKHTFERKGDRWVTKKKKGPSDSRSARSPARGEEGGETFGGVDVIGNSKQDLYERARKLGVRGRSSMNKKELARAIARKQG